MKRLYLSFGLIISMCVSVEASRVFREPIEEVGGMIPRRIIRSYLPHEYKHLPVLPYAGAFKSTRPLFDSFHFSRLPDPTFASPLVVQKRWASRRTPLDLNLPHFADPTKDLVFKGLFKRPENKALLINFLNATLNKTGRKAINDVQIQDGEHSPRFFKDEKKSILDIFCTDKSGDHYIVEMEKDVNVQHTREGYFKRVRMYAGRTYAQQLKPGQSYKTLKPVMCLVITDSEAFPQDPKRFISTHRILDVESYENHLKDLSWTFIQIPKFSKKEGELKTELDEWLFLFKEGHKKAARPRVKSPTVQKAYTWLEMSTWSEKDRINYIRADMARLDEINKREVAEDRGHTKALVSLARSWSQEGKKVNKIADLLKKPESWVQEILHKDPEDL